MRLEFEKNSAGYVEASFKDASDFDALISAQDDKYLYFGVKIYCVQLTRGMAYALHSAIETWLDTGELPTSIECSDDPPRRGTGEPNDPLDRFHKPCGHDIAAGCDCAEN